MKTIFKTITSYHKAIEKRKWFEERTGLKWNFYLAKNGMQFNPIITLQTPLNEKLAEKLLPFLTTEYLGFVHLSDISKMKLADVMIAANTLVRYKQAICGFNRMTNFATIRAKTKYELLCSD